MKVARGTLAIFLPLALAFLLAFAACTASRTHVNGKGTQHPKAGDNEGVYSDRKEKVSTNTWCIAKPSTDNDRLLQNVEYCCGQVHVNCSSIQLGGSCFHPNKAVSHASFAMNLFYKASGKHPWNCHFNGSGLIVFDNPSFGNCQYPD